MNVLLCWDSYGIDYDYYIIEMPEADYEKYKVCNGEFINGITDNDILDKLNDLKSLINTLEDNSTLVILVEENNLTINKLSIDDSDISTCEKLIHCGIID